MLSTIRQLAAAIAVLASPVTVFAAGPAPLEGQSFALTGDGVRALFHGE